VRTGNEGEKKNAREKNKSQEVKPFAAIQTKQPRDNEGTSATVEADLICGTNAQD